MAFLRVGSDFRLAWIDALKNHLNLNSVNLVEDRLMHVSVAEYLEDIDGEPSLDELASYVESAYGKGLHNDRVVERLIDARIRYEHFFDGIPPWNIDGWSADLIALASDLYSRSDLEIAATVWYDARIVAKTQNTVSSVKVPQFEVDHRLLGFGRHILLSNNIGLYEPFFEVQYPVVGVCGVNKAWMYLASDEVDRFGAEINECLASQWPEAARVFLDLDVPILNRPLGFEGVRFSAEALVRHLTIEETVVNVFDRLTKASRAHDALQSDSTSSQLVQYMNEVLNVGFLSRPVIFDGISLEKRRIDLASRLADSFQRREDVFSAWLRYVDYAKACGVAVRDLSQECREVQFLFEKKFPGQYFTANLLRRCVDLLNDRVPVVDVVDGLNFSSDSAALGLARQRVIRVSGPSSPAVVTN